MDTCSITLEEINVNIHNVKPQLLLKRWLTWLTQPDDLDTFYLYDSSSEEKTWQMWITKSNNVTQLEKYLVLGSYIFVI